MAASGRVTRLLNHLSPKEGVMASPTKFSDDDVVILSAVRTPMGAYGGAFASMSATQLGAISIREALNRANISGDMVDEVYMGNVLQANVGQNPARQALLAAGIPDTCPATTVNKVCASGMKALSIGMGTIKMGYNDIVVVGGMESMSNVPHYVNSLRFGCKFGNQELTDGMLKDGLTDCYNNCHMGTLAELCADDHNISREEQDNFAITSFNRARENAHLMESEIVPVPVPQRRGDPILVKTDEPVEKGNLSKIPKLRPAFSKLPNSASSNRSVTAGNSSSLADGAATLILCSGAKARELGLTPMAKVLSYADAAQDPKYFTTAPSLAVPLAMERAGLSMSDIGPDDYFELNEAFSVVGVANMKLLGISPERTNVFGGGVSMGHPLGCSGARILVTLLNVLNQKNGRYGIAALCNGGGGASALIIQRL